MYITEQGQYDYVYSRHLYSVTGFGTQSTRRNGHMIYVKIYENNSFTTKHDRKLEADVKVPAGDIVFAITYFN